jgi:hypothetical protein
MTWHWDDLGTARTADAFKDRVLPSDELALIAKCLKCMNMRCITDTRQTRSAQRPCEIAGFLYLYTVLYAQVFLSSKRSRIPTPSDRLPLMIILIQLIN